MEFNELLTPSETTGAIPGSDGVSFVDADTVRDATGQTYRLPGISAPEVAHFTGTGLSAGEVGGAMTTEQVNRLANSMGFTNLKPQLDENGEPVRDAGGNRIMADLYDDQGRAFSKMLVQERIVSAHPDYDPGGILSQSGDYGAFMDTKLGGQDDEWAAARKAIGASINDEQRYNNQFKLQQQRSGDWAAWNRWAEENGVPLSQNPYNKTSAQFEYADRDVATGKAHNNIATAFNTGMEGVVESGYGMLELIGDRTEWDALANIGTQGINRARMRIGDQGSILTDYKDVDGFWSAMEFVGNNAALSLPYMGVTVAGTALAPFTAGLSLTAPAGMYAGQTWNEMEGEKSATIAIGAGVAMATLDRLGLGFLIKQGVAPKKLMQEAVEELVKKGSTREAAEATVMQASRKELAGFVGDAVTVARNQIAAGQIAKDMVSKAGIGLAGEGATEVMQEGTGYLAATLGSDKEFNAEELVERLQQAAVAGSVLGGAFSAPGAAYNAGAWADVAYRLAPAEQKRLSQAGKFAEQEVRDNGRVASIPELLAEGKARRATGVPGATLDEMAEADVSRRKDRTWGDTLVDMFHAMPALWQGSTRFIFKPELQEQSRSLRILADMFGGNLQRTFSGSSFENAKHHLVSMYKNLAPIPDKFFSEYAGGKRLTRKQKAEVSDEIYQKLRNAVDEDGNFDPNLIPNTDPHKQLLVGLQQQLEVMADKMYNDQVKHNPNLGRLKNYLLRYKSFDKRAIAKNKHEFVQKLMDKANMTESEAVAIADAIIGNAEVNDFAEAFSITQGGGGVPGSHQARTLNLSEDVNFDQFMERDIFANLSNAAKSAAKYTARQEYVGSNGEVIAELLDQARAEGVSPEAINQIARQMKDYLDAESGNYKRPTTAAGKKLETIQRNFMMFTTLAGLPLATISSFVELALTMKGLTLDQVIGKDGNGGLKAIGEEFADTLWKGMQTVAGPVTGKQVLPSETRGKERLRDLGFYDWDVGAATTTGVTETNPMQQHIYEMFFKATGLQGWTNYTRSVRAALAGDYIFDKLEKAAEADPDTATNEVQEAREGLRNLGLNVEDMLGWLDAARHGEITPEMQAIFDENMREATFNFVNEAVALPQSANRPLIYQDPRFALFTQFQGFMATFTANHIPKLWGEYVKRGTPAMKYNAFAVMTTMIMLGFVSQHLKDLIKYGWDEDAERRRKTGANPYLDQAEYIQRGIRSSGLLGTGERVLDQFFPLYETNTHGVGDWLWESSTGESPALSNLKRLGKAGGAVLQGDAEKAIKQTLKSTPITGPFSSFNETVSKGLGSGKWEF